MNELTTFTNEEFGSVRTVTVDDEPWFVGKDIALALEYSNPRDAIAKHVDKEDKTDGVAIRDSIGREQYPTVINESGLYCLIFSSKLPGAKRFKRWVTSKVLPALRKTGRYETSKAAERDLTRDDFLRAAQIVATCRNERLPYVFDFLKQAGITPQTVQPLLLYSAKRLLEDGETDEQEERREFEERTAVIQAFVDKPVPEDWAKWSINERRAYWRGEASAIPDGQEIRLVERDRVCAREIWCELMGRNLGDIHSTDTREINAILEHLHGWQRNVNPLWFGPYNQQRGYVRIRQTDTIEFYNGCLEPA